ncbi:isopentenyl-diphosphate Delta-isomerase 1 isoform X1, partial [Tachysurus ichikawai]
MACALRAVLRTVAGKGQNVFRPFKVCEVRPLHQQAVLCSSPALRSTLIC